MANRWGNSGNSDRFYFVGAPKSMQMVTAAMKLRYLLLGRKVMTKLDSILKSRDITLSTKVHIIKAMFFPVVMLDKTLERVPCKEIKPVSPKGNHS